MVLVLSMATAASQKQRHTFALGERDFLLDGKPFQIISGEMHPARIPREYWGHRIRMAKAMECNTIAAYIFWNYHESEPGRFDFKTESRDIGAFIRMAQQEGLWVLLRQIGIGWSPLRGFGLMKWNHRRSRPDYVLTFAQTGNPAREWQFPFTLEMYTP